MKWKKVQVEVHDLVVDMFPSCLNVLSRGESRIKHMLVTKTRFIE